MMYRRRYVPFYFLYRGSNSGGMQVLVVGLVALLVLIAWWVAVPAIGGYVLWALVYDVRNSYRHKYYGEMVFVACFVPLYAAFYAVVLYFVLKSFMIVP